MPQKNKNSSNSKKNKSVFAIFVSYVLLVVILFSIFMVVLKKVDPAAAKKIDTTVESVFSKINGTSKSENKTEQTKKDNDSFTENSESLEKNEDSSINNTVSDSQTEEKSSTSKSNGQWIPSENENSNFYFGNPSNATAELSNAQNYLMQKEQFVLSYNNQTLIPNWVSWHLCSEDLGEVSRGDDFRPDTDLPSGWYKVLKSDYQYTKYNFDRGHVCPSADRTKSQEDNSNTFLMTNMIPQSPDLNRQIWKEFESFERELTLSGKELYIVAGPYGKGGTTATGTWDYIEISAKKGFNAQKILVPSHCWKIVLVLDEGENDYSRVTNETPVISIFMPNRMGMHKTSTWKDYLTCVDDIEEKTGYDFFACLPDSVEDFIEQKVYLKND